ncbi:hypothetical protein [Clostridium sp.]|jgi:hypothetical protein|uniref:hypothetical protein n=1 Tax=Clostridium sp. TaxID=1506 RepID=UPI00290412A3|nr:hypothetical protein [Clostridium sp.]MDU2155962.1 hypothetical protein [Clostridium sp.]
MEKKIILSIKENGMVNVEESNIENGQELYQCLCALSSHIALKLKDMEDITKMCEQAGKDSLDMIKEQQMN